MTEEEMEEPISFWGYKEQESNLILPEHDDMMMIFWNETLHVLDSSSVHHEFFIVHIPLLCVQWKTPDDGQSNCPKHAEFHSKK